MNKYLHVGMHPLAARLDSVLLRAIRAASRCQEFPVWGIPEKGSTLNPIDPIPYRLLRFRAEAK